MERDFERRVAVEPVAPPRLRLFLLSGVFSISWRASSESERSTDNSLLKVRQWLGTGHPRSAEKVVNRRRDKRNEIRVPLRFHCGMKPGRRH